MLFSCGIGLRDIGVPRYRDTKDVRQGEPFQPIILHQWSGNIQQEDASGSAYSGSIAKVDRGKGKTDDN
jgi:hypothetical protein